MVVILSRVISRTCEYFENMSSSDFYCYWLGVRVNEAGCKSCLNEGGYLCGVKDD